MNIIDQHMRVAIYIRVSTKMQEDKYSLRAQQTELTAYANKMGWTIIEIFKDVDSGGKFEKQGLESLLDAVEDGLVDVVLVMEQDRLSRLDAVDWNLLKDILRENDVKIAEPGNIVNLRNEDEEFISDIKNLYAAFQRRKIKRSVGRGLRQYAREGKLMGRQPFEYIYDRRTNSVTVNEDNAWIIPYIDKLYLEEGYGYQRIVSALNKLCKSPTGSKWSTTQVKYRLRNKAYHGVLEKTFSDGSTITVENVYPPLRTKETYEKIQLKMQEVDFRIDTVAGFHHALRHIKMLCKCCGRTLSLVKSGHLHDGRFNVYVTHAREYAVDCTTEPSYNADQVSRPLFQLVKSILLHSNSIQQYLKTQKEEEANIEILVHELDMMRTRIESNNEKLDRLLDLYLDGKWSSEKLDESKIRIENENAELAKDIERQARKIDLIKRNSYNLESYLTVIGSLEHYLPIFVRMEELGELMPVELDAKDQEDLIRNLFTHMEIDGLTHTAKIYGKSVENVPMVFDLEIDEENIVAKERLRKRQYKRYLETQRLIDAQDTPISFMELKRLTGLNVQTLNEDQQLFGPYRGLKLKKNSVEKKEAALEIIKQCLCEDVKMTSVDIAKRAGINPATVLKYIREYKLRLGRQRI